MNMKNVNITREDGTTVAASLIAYINVGNDYGIYYTMNEPGSSEQTVKVYYGKEKQNNPMLDTPLSGEEWSNANTYMREVLKGIDNPELKYLPPKDNYEIVAFNATNMPISYDYINKQSTIYYNAVNQMAATKVEETSAAPETSAPAVDNAANIFENPASGASDIQVETPAAEEADKPMPQANIMEPQAPSISPDINIPSVGDVLTDTSPVDEIVPAPETSEIIPDAPAPETSEVPNAFDNITPTAVNNEATVISIEEIKEKYNKMRETIDQLEKMEIEAVNRIEDTKKLNEMHNEQHAESVAQDMGINVEPGLSSDISETNTPEPIVSQPADTQMSPVPEMTDSIISQTDPALQPSIEGIPVENPAPIEPVTPVVPSAPVTDAGETNWFDTPTAA